jgi:hypothetical protein
LDRDTSLYAEYLLEREGISLISNEHGFATYRKLDTGDYWMMDVFVKKQKKSNSGWSGRRAGVAHQLSRDIAAIAKKDGANFLVTSICLDVNGVTESMKAILGDGFRYANSNGNMLFFNKSLVGEI